MAKISVVVLTKNEEKNIWDCLETVRWADELIVLDSLSTDRTVAIAQQYTPRVYQREFKNWPDQRNFALTLATGDWVFFVDADERSTPELEAEVRRVTRDRIPVGWWVPRKNIIFGRWIRHTGWSPDYQLRLFQRKKGRYDTKRLVHELVILDGEAGYLKNTLTHLNYDSLGQFRAKQQVYTDHQAQMLKTQGVRPRWQSYLGQPLREFLRRFFKLEGYRDGFHGLLLSLLMAYYAWLTYRKLGGLWRRSPL